MKGLVKEKTSEMMNYFKNIFHLGERNLLPRAQNVQEQLYSQLLIFWDDHRRIFSRKSQIKMRPNQAYEKISDL